jgi:hypothetical protein
MKKFILLMICLLICGCSTSGRYQVTPSSAYPPILLDTKTGKTWYAYPGVPVWIPLPKGEYDPKDPKKIRILPQDKVN